VIDLILTILSLAVSILRQQQIAHPGTMVSADSILEIIRAAHAAYEKETGQPVNPDLIKPYEPIP
jgi:hypothetical protein